MMGVTCVWLTICRARNSVAEADPHVSATSIPVEISQKKLVSRVLREEGTCGGCTYGQHVGGRLVVDDLSGPLSRLFALQGGRTHRLVDGVVKAPGSPSMQ